MILQKITTLNKLLLNSDLMVPHNEIAKRTLQKDIM